jgi:hypothetical protein
MHTMEQIRQNHRASTAAKGRAWVAAGLFGALVATPSGWAAGEAPLNGELVMGGDVQAFEVLETDVVVYIADQDTDGVNELFSVPLAGGAAVKLCSALPAGSNVKSFQALGAMVVYLADQDTPGQDELFYVPATGGTPVKLSGTLTAGGDVQSFQFFPDGYVYYLADSVLDDRVELFKTTIGGGTPLKLNGPMIDAGDVQAFEVSGTSVVYLADQFGDETVELFRVATSGGTVTKLNPNISADRDVTDFQIDGSYVYYRADQASNDTFYIYRVHIAGGTVTLVNTGVGQVSVSRFVVDSSNSRVVYVGGSGSYLQLYSSTTTGTTSTLLNDPLPGGVHGGAYVRDDFDLANGNVVYRADQISQGVVELFGVGVTGGTVNRLNQDLPVGSGIDGFSVSGSSVIYIADEDEEGVFELFQTSASGSFHEKLNRPLVEGGDVHSVEILSSGGIVYFADQLIDDRVELFRRWSSSASERLSGTVVPDGDVVEVRSNSSGDIVYLADRNSDEVFELFPEITHQRLWKNQGGGTWNVASNWEPTLPGGENTSATIEKSVVVDFTTDYTPIGRLLLGGGPGTSVLNIQDGSSLVASLGVFLSPGGVIRGDGFVSSGLVDLEIPAGAEISAGSGDMLRIASGSVSNEGRIEAFGVAASRAEIDFSGSVVNENGTGLIACHDAVVRFREDLVNEGTVSFTGGFSDLLGEVNNGSQGRLVITGGASTVFYDDVQNDGTIEANASGTLQSVVVFLGALSGNGVSGGGHVFVEGDARPGFSPGTMTFGGDLSLGSSAHFQFDVEGTTAGVDYDQVVVAGALELNGVLEVQLTNGFTPQIGDSFDLWDAGSVSGQFSSVILPDLPAGHFWNTSSLNTTGEVNVGSAPNSYAAFAALNNLTTPPNGDQDNDGASNLMEYLFGGDPVVQDNVNPSGSVAVNGGTATFSIAINSVAADDVVFEIQESPDLSQWNGLATRSAGGVWSGSFPVDVDETEPGTVELSLDQPVGGQAKRFYRFTAAVE